MSTLSIRSSVSGNHYVYDSGICTRKPISALLTKFKIPCWYQAPSLRKQMVKTTQVTKSTGMLSWSMCDIWTTHMRSSNDQWRITTNNAPQVLLLSCFLAQMEFWMLMVLVSGSLVEMSQSTQEPYLDHTPMCLVFLKVSAQTIWCGNKGWQQISAAGPLTRVKHSTFEIRTTLTSSIPMQLLRATTPLPVFTCGISVQTVVSVSLNLKQFFLEFTDSVQICDHGGCKWKIWGHQGVAFFHLLCA